MSTSRRGQTAPYAATPPGAPPTGRRNLSLVATGVVLVLLLVSALVLDIHAQDVRARARQQATALEARRQAQLAAARGRTLDAAHTTYLELATLRSALDGVPDPATRTADERASERAFWSQAHQRSLQRLAGVPQTFDNDLQAAVPQWPALDRAAQAGLGQISRTQAYLDALYGGVPSAQLWLDRDAMRSAVQRDVRALVVAMAPVCTAAQPFDRERAADCYDIQVDLPHSG